MTTTQRHDKAPTIKELRLWRKDWSVTKARVIDWAVEMAIKAGEWPCECGYLGYERGPVGNAHDYTGPDCRPNAL